MFNNPFDSFHNTVADSKEEREQLDRLLTISTPRERLLVVAIALLLFAVLAWLFFGDVARSLAVDGVLVEPGESSVEGSQSVQALVWIESDSAPHIEAGMQVSIELAMADGEADTRDGEVATIAAVSVAEGLAAYEAAVPVSVYRVDILLDERLEFASLAGRECLIVIELGGHSPVSFLHMRRS